MINCFYKAAASISLNINNLLDIIINKTMTSRKYKTGIQVNYQHHMKKKTYSLKQLYKKQNI